MNVRIYYGCCFSLKEMNKAIYCHKEYEDKRLTRGLKYAVQQCEYCPLLSVDNCVTIVKKFKGDIKRGFVTDD